MEEVGGDLVTQILHLVAERLSFSLPPFGAQSKGRRRREGGPKLKVVNNTRKGNRVEEKKKENQADDDCLRRARPMEFLYFRKFFFWKE